MLLFTSPMRVSIIQDLRTVGRLEFEIRTPAIHLIFALTLPEIRQICLDGSIIGFSLLVKDIGGR